MRQEKSKSSPGGLHSGPRLISSSVEITSSQLPLSYQLLHVFVPCVLLALLAAGFEHFILLLFFLNIKSDIQAKYNLSYKTQERHKGCNFQINTEQIMQKKKSSRTHHKSQFSLISLAREFWISEFDTYILFFPFTIIFYRLLAF